MQIRRLFSASSWLLAACVLTFAQPSEAQNYPLELTNIGPVGVNGMHANNRIFRAYPGLVYNIRAAVIGGTFPYSFSLQNAPAGMTINSGTGEIDWVNPQSNATPTIIISDSAGAQISRSWTISVSTSGFKFVDAVFGVNAANNGCSANCGTGTISSPWRNLTDLARNDSVSDITYFRSGTYNVQEVPSAFREGIGGVWERVVFSDNPSSAFPGSTIWLNYPGHTPLLDFTCLTCAEGLAIRHAGQNIYIDGFETRDSAIIAFQAEPNAAYRGGTYRNLNMHDHGPGGDGTNSSFILTLSSYPNVSYGMVIQDSTFSNVTSLDPDDAVTIKIYSQNKLLISDTVTYNTVTAIELKADVRQFTVRGNTFSNVTGTAIGGNMHGCSQPACSSTQDVQTTSGEILFNSVRVTGTSARALRVNQDGQALRIDIYRNTFFGRVELQSVDSADGVFTLARNVIVNSDSGTPANSHVSHLNVTAPSRIVLTNNLVGYPADNVIDSSNNLTAAFASFIGTRGHQRAGGPSQVRGLTVSPP